jgi:hypothetical protein
MTAEYILRAAVKTVAQGGESTRSAQSEVDNIGFASSYAEPGYTDPECNRGIFFANWNNLPVKTTDLLEKAGYAIEWSDEWAFCDDCGKAVRTSPNSYGWQQSYSLVDDYSIVCVECLDPVVHLESLEDKPTSCNTIDRINPADHGYIKYNGRFESGFHPGQDDDPKKTYQLMRDLGLSHILFNLDTAQQFDIYWSAWYKPENTDTDIEEN